MTRAGFILFIVIVAVLPGILKKIPKGTISSSMKDIQKSSMPHKHKKEGVYETYNKKTHNTQSGAMPHAHETKHYTSMSDASKLPKGYILLNGEPVRVADLEDK